MIYSHGTNNHKFITILGRLLHQRMGRRRRLQMGPVHQRTPYRLCRALISAVSSPCGYNSNSLEDLMRVSESCLSPSTGTKVESGTIPPKATEVRTVWNRWTVLAELIEVGSLLTIRQNFVSLRNLEARGKPHVGSRTTM